MTAKRIFDVLAASVGLLLLAPLLVVIALWVRLDSPGPVLFRHRRVGRAGRPFQVLKFRTMHAAPQPGAPEVTAASDSRITRAGRRLRASKLDELPQLLNVLRGEMSIVGPRPEVERYVNLYPEAARREILSVRPGITDLAAIEFRNEQDLLDASADPEDTYVRQILPRKIALYRQYVGTRSMLLDLAIIARTVAAIVR